MRGEGFEPSTKGLKVPCSTAELAPRNARLLILALAGRRTVARGSPKPTCIPMRGDGSLAPSLRHANGPVDRLQELGVPAGHREIRVTQPVDQRPCVWVAGHARGDRASDGPADAMSAAPSPRRWPLTARALRTRPG